LNDSYGVSSCIGGVERCRGSTTGPAVGSNRFTRTSSCIGRNRAAWVGTGDRTVVGSIYRWTASIYYSRARTGSGTTVRLCNRYRVGVSVAYRDAGSRSATRTPGVAGDGVRTGSCCSSGERGRRVGTGDHGCRIAGNGRIGIVQSQRGRRRSGTTVTGLNDSYGVSACIGSIERSRGSTTGPAVRSDGLAGTCCCIGRNRAAWVSTGDWTIVGSIYRWTASIYYSRARAGSGTTVRLCNRYRVGVTVVNTDAARSCTTW